MYIILYYGDNMLWNDDIQTIQRDMLINQLMPFIAFSPN